MDDFTSLNGNRPAKDGTVKDKSVKFAVFAAGIGVRRKIAEKRVVEFAASEAGVENLRIDAGGDGAETLRVKEADEFAGVAPPDGKKSGHADTREIFFAVGTQVLKENVAKSDPANALIAEDAQGMLHAGFVDGVYALRRNANFVQRQADGFGLLKEKLAADAVHADALEAFGHGGQQRRNTELLLLEEHVQRDGTVFAAAPAEKDGFGCGHNKFSVISVQFSVKEEKHAWFCFLS
jgi:hypothetical protein